MERYAIRFDFPESAVAVYAGPFKGSVGYARSLSTAFTFTEREGAEDMLANAYGDETRSFGRVVDAWEELAALQPDED